MELINYYLLSCGIGVSLALTIGAYSLDESLQIQANTLLIRNYFLHIIILNSYANVMAKEDSVLVFLGAFF